MSEGPLQILAVIGSLSRRSTTRPVIQYVAERLRAAGSRVDLVDFLETPLPLFEPETSYRSAVYAELKPRVETADVFLLGTPDYHGSVSSALKNFLDHFWREFAGKLFATIVGSHEKGLTVTDQLRTMARQCYAWSLPYGVAFMDKEDVQDGRVSSDPLKERLEMLARDIRVYGHLLARQRTADLGGTEPGFLARHRT